MNSPRSKLLYFTILLILSLGLQPAINTFYFFSQKKVSAPTFLTLGSQRLALNPIRKQFSLPKNKLDWARFGSANSITIENERMPSSFIKSVDILIENSSGHAVFNTDTLDADFWRMIQAKFRGQASLYIKVTDKSGKQYGGLVSGPTGQGVYGEQLMLGTFYEFESLSIRGEGPEIAFAKEFPIMLLQDIKQNSSVPITYISNETALNNLECKLSFASESKDSLHVLIKSGHGNIRKVGFANSEDIKLKSLLTQHVEETTIYFCEGSPRIEDRKLGILVISDEKKLLSVQSSLMDKLVGMTLTDIDCDYLYFSPANLDFVWGDIELRLTKNKEGNYHARKRISKSRWEKSIHKSPNLMMGKTLNMDSLSFNFSITSQHKDTINEVRIENVHSEDFSSTIKVNLSDTLMSAPNRNSIIRLDDIHNEGLDNTNISLELEIYDDSPKAKEKKYQLHWGYLDTTLTQQGQKKFFSESLAMSISQFSQLLLKEPVLTSSSKGVVDAFVFELAHSREGAKLQTMQIKTNIKDASVFLQSIKKFKLDNNIAVGDKFSLQNFSGEELPKQEQLLVNILIDSDEQQEASIDDANVFLNWGESILKTIPLLDNSRKKKVQDQIIERATLLHIINQPMVLNQFGVKEAIVSAEWFINEDIYTKQKCSSEWKECFATYINSAKAGDFVSLFLRTKNGNGAICQFYLDKIKGEDIIGFGNTEFDSLLFKYAKQTFRSDTRPKYDYDFVWGNAEFTLEFKGSPRVFGGEFKIDQRKLEALLDEKIYINSSDGEVISVNHAYLYRTNYKSRNSKRRGKWTSYDFDCENLDCRLNSEDAQKLLKELEEEVYSIRVFIDQHTQSEEFVKVSFIDFIIENESNAWLPTEWVTSNVDTDIFEFQFVYQEKEKTLVKLDKQNEKYQWIVDKYENDPSVELIDIPTFKTIQRAIYTKNDKGSNKGIRRTEVLSKDYTNAYTLNDYHDLKGSSAKLFWKGYQSLYGGQTYCKDDFICADGELQLHIGNDIVPILRGDLIILPESGPGYKFIFDDVDSIEIVSILQDLPPKTNLFFENIIIPDDKGEPVRLPLKFAYHLE